MIKDISSKIKKMFVFEITNRYLRVLYFFLIAFLSLSFSLTILFQAPFFIEHNVNPLSNFLWLIVIFLLLLIDYKHFFTTLFKAILFLVPFFIYLLICFLLKIPALNNGTTRVIFISLMVFFVSLCVKRFIKKAHLLFFLKLFCVTSALLALTILFSKLIGYDLSNPIYAYSSKNSAGPIFLAAMIIVHFLSRNKISIWLVAFDIASILFFSFVIALLKCRAALICIPIFLLWVLIDFSKHKVAGLLTGLFFFILFVSIIAIPQLRNLVINQILLNNKNAFNLDDLFSGRIQTIVDGFLNFEPLLGNGTAYIDCMPVSLLCCYGIIGFLTLLPFVILPFIISFGNKDEYSRRLLWPLGFAYAINALFEGYGMFGPGAKTFIFWFVVGYYCEKSIFGTFLFATSKPTEKALQFIPPHIVSASVSSVFVVAGCIFLALSPSKNTFSQKVFDSFPVSKKSVEYVMPKSIEISGPTDVCVGQKIKYDSIVLPNNATDKQTSWVSYNSQCVEIDTETGIAEIKKSGNVNISAFSLRKKELYNEKLLRIVDLEDYVFDDFKIFSTKEGLIQDIKLSINESIQVFYDTDYVPSQGTRVEFYSSNDSVCSIDDSGIIRTKNKGTSKINGALIVGNNVFYSTNYIDITVCETTLNTVDSIDFAIPLDVYEKDVFYLDVVFNDNNGKCDEKYSVETSDNLVFNPSDNSIKCIKKGDAFVKVSSLFDNNVFNIKKTFVKEIKPIRFILNDNWWTIGTISRLDLYLEYDNGSTHYVELEDVIYEKNEFDGRAYANKNGIVDNYLTRAAITVGSISVKVVSSKDNSIILSATIKVSSYPQQEYYSRIRFVSFFFSNILFSIGLLFFYSIEKTPLFLKTIITMIFSLLINVFLCTLIVKNYISLLFSLIPILLSAVLYLIIKKMKMNYLPIFCNETLVLNVYNDKVANYYEVSI